MQSYKPLSRYMTNIGHKIRFKTSFKKYLEEKILRASHTPFQWHIFQCFMTFNTRKYCTFQSLIEPCQGGVIVQADLSVSFCGIRVGVSTAWDWQDFFLLLSAFWFYTSNQVFIYTFSQYFCQILQAFYFCFLLKSLRILQNP